MTDRRFRTTAQALAEELHRGYATHHALRLSRTLQALGLRPGRATVQEFRTAAQLLGQHLAEESRRRREQLTTGATPRAPSPEAAPTWVGAATTPDEDPTP